MDPIWLLIAFMLGFAAKQAGLPPLVGFLAAGFVLNAMGVESSETLQMISDYGIYLLLFGIGLKLKVKNLLKPEIWATATTHMVVTTAVFSICVYILSVISFSLFTDLDYLTSLLIAFALSFSSTVFAVKILEEKGESSSPYGRIAIGILIIQDIFAVIYLSFTKGELPTIWALLVLVLLALPRVLKFSPISKILDKSGHGELLVLLGVLIPIGSAAAFDAVNLKPDLGALILGVLISGHPKADELSNSIMSFKDIFLVGFFLTIGLSGIPSLEAIGIAILLSIVMLFKTGLFFMLLTRFKLRARTATLASLSLTNYSEFGLIVGAAGAAAGWMNNEWLIIFAVALSITFIISSPLNTKAHKIYSRRHSWLQKFESAERLPYEQPITVGDANIVILGMGHMGAGAYDALESKYQSKVAGIEYKEEIAERNLKAGRNVINGDATDSDFWERICPTHKVKMVVLAMTDHASNMQVLKELKNYNFDGRVTATAVYDDEIEELKEAGADEAFNFYAEAGAGFADHICEIYEK
jgi:predicted Kef-type K+ transport protein